MSKKQESVVHRIGIILGPLGKKPNLDAIRYLLLHLNSIQKSFELELLPFDSSDVFIKRLASKKEISRQDVKNDSQKFLERYRKYLANLHVDYELKEEPPDNIVLVTIAKFIDNYYTSRSQAISVLALGNWERSMAPPSMVEFIFTLVLREAIAIIIPSLNSSVHLGTKGCLFDFTLYLSEVRYKILGGYVCEHCRNILLDEGTRELLQDLEVVLDKKWLGKVDDPQSPAGIMANLGYDLFLTKGLKNNLWDNVSITLQKEATKQVVEIIGNIILTALLIMLGLEIVQ